MALPLIPVQFREKDPEGRVSLVNKWTREYLEEHGIGLTEGLDVHLCQPVSDEHGALDWEYAEGRATYAAEPGFWLAELQSPPGRASRSPLGHWSRRIPTDLLGPLAGNRFLDLDLAAAAIERHRQDWITRGFDVGPLTWRDWGDGWTHPYVDRVQATNPDSVGVLVHRGGAEGRLVLYRGG